MSRKGNCIDSSVMKNFFGVLKQEIYYGTTFYSFYELKPAIEKYIEYYNIKRTKQKLGYFSLWNIGKTAKLHKNSVVTSVTTLSGLTFGGRYTLYSFKFNLTIFAILVSVATALILAVRIGITIIILILIVSVWNAIAVPIALREDIFI